MADLWPVISAPLTSEGERLLLDIIRFEGRLQLTVSSELPHSMPPEDMLKSLAIQAIARWTGLSHLHEMLKMELTTSSSSLSSLVSDVIQKARETRPAVWNRSAPEEIEESSSEEQVEESRSEAGYRVVTRPVEKHKIVTLQTDRGMSFFPGWRARMPIANWNQSANPTRHREQAMSGELS